jgi:hypothetical protein
VPRVDRAAGRRQLLYGRRSLDAEREWLEAVERELGA